LNRSICAAGLVALMVVLTLTTSAAAAPVTIGANVADTSNTSNAGCDPICTFQVTADVPAQPMQAPCTGGVIRWRVNATTSATFKLRIIRDNENGTFTSTASSAAETTSGAGIAVFPTSLPIAAGQYIGVDILAAGVLLGRVASGGGNVFRPPMVDGTPQSAEFVGAPNNVLLSADVACPRPLTVIKAGTGQGTVASDPAGIDCGPTCAANFWDTTQVNLKATPAAGSIFAGWSGGGCSGTSGCIVTMGDSNAVAATFTVGCVVPKLKGKTLGKAKKKIRNRDCQLGKVKGPRGGRVKKQKPKPGQVVPLGTKVKLKLG
jgi:Divergent InlB B-repeat domain/PASTA domain